MEGTTPSEAPKWIEKVYVKTPLFVSELVERWKGMYIADIKLTGDVILNLIKYREIMAYRFTHYAFCHGERVFAGVPEPIPDVKDISEIANEYFVCLDLIDGYEVSNRISIAKAHAAMDRAFAYHQIEQLKLTNEERRQRVLSLEMMIEHQEIKIEEYKSKITELQKMVDMVSSDMDARCESVYLDLLYGLLINGFANPFIRQRDGALVLNRELTSWMIQILDMAGVSKTEPTVRKYLRAVLEKVAKRK